MEKQEIWAQKKCFFHMLYGKRKFLSLSLVLFFSLLHTYIYREKTNLEVSTEKQNFGICITFEIQHHLGAGKMAQWVKSLSM